MSFMLRDNTEMTWKSHLIRSVTTSTGRKRRRRRKWIKTKRWKKEARAASRPAPCGVFLFVIAVSNCIMVSAFMKQPHRREITFNSIRISPPLSWLRFGVKSSDHPFFPPSLVREDRKTTSSLFRDLPKGTRRYKRTKTQTWSLFILKTQRVLCDR